MRVFWRAKALIARRLIDNPPDVRLALMFIPASLELQSRANLLQWLQLGFACIEDNNYNARGYELGARAEICAVLAASARFGAASAGQKRSLERKIVDVRARVLEIPFYARYNDRPSGAESDQSRNGEISRKCNRELIG
jgi:hypothetical protein